MITITRRMSGTLADLRALRQDRRNAWVHLMTWPDRTRPLASYATAYEAACGRYASALRDAGGVRALLRAVRFDLAPYCLGHVVDHVWAPPRGTYRLRDGERTCLVCGAHQVAAPT